MGLDIWVRVQILQKSRIYINIHYRPNVSMDLLVQDQISSSFWCGPSVSVDILHGAKCPTRIIRVYCEHLQSARPCARCWVSELDGKLVLQAKSHGLPCTCALPAAPYLLPRPGPGRATPGCSQRFGLQPGVLTKVPRTSTRGAVWAMCVNDNEFCCQIALLGATFRSCLPLFKHHPVSSLPEGELLPVIPSLSVPHTTANLHFFVTRPQP